MARIEFIRSGSCAGCSGDQGCGLGPVLAMFHRPQPHSLEFDTGHDRLELNVGDTVRIAMAGHELLKIVSLAYLLPLLGMFCGAWLAAAALPGEPDISAVIGALGGLFFVSGLLARTGVTEVGNYMRSAHIQPLARARSGGD